MEDENSDTYHDYHNLEMDDSDGNGTGTVDPVVYHSDFEEPVFTHPLEETTDDLELDELGASEFVKNLFL